MQVDKDGNNDGGCMRTQSAAVVSTLHYCSRVWMLLLLLLLSIVAEVVIADDDDEGHGEDEMLLAADDMNYR